jgi:transcriptional regulator with XRE-family HTH domain
VGVADRGELAEFLRSHRERVTPEAVGLPLFGRRRTPGLRREELATLAGVSIDYLVRLEQGRDTNPSAAVVMALADALGLTVDEKRHFVMLALKTNGALLEELCPTHGAVSNEIRPTLRTLLDRVNPTPAFVAGRLSDVLAWNESWRTLVTPLGILDEEQPNLARYIFLNPASRRVMSDWAGAADGQTSVLRAAHPRWGSDPQFVALIDELRAEPEFAKRWEAHTISLRRPRVARLVHPDAGQLVLTLESLTTDDAQHLETWLPYDETTEAAIRTLLATSLRIVRRA